MRIIKRNYYLDKMKPYIGKELIKVLVGQRRVGKSVMLLQVMDFIRETEPKASILHVNMELRKFAFIKTSDDLLDYVEEHTNGAELTYLFIDEIQDIPFFEKALRSLNAEGKYDIYCTGSNANLLSSEISTYLSGRSIEIEIFGLSYPEFQEFHALPNDQDTLMKFIKYGGLPYLINLEFEDGVIYEYLKNTYSTILFKDVVTRNNIRNIAFLERLVEFLADNIGSIVSAKKISDFLKSQKTNISPNVVLNYLTYLSDAFFIFKVKRADVVGKKIFEIGEKYYFDDLGLRHSIIPYTPNDISKILENLVFQHLKISGFSVKVGKLGTKEIDFIASRNDEHIYIQVTYLLPDQKVIDREFGNLLVIPDNYPKYVISMDELAPGNYKGIKNIHIREFLKKLL